MSVNKIFYILKPIIPRRLQLALRRLVVLRQRKMYSDIWPIKSNAINPPNNWKGWPKGKRFSLILTHDVETKKGQEKCIKLLEIEKKLGFHSSFNFVPERYKVDLELLKALKKNGFEVGIHGLKHDGKLYKNKDFFLKRANKINEYLAQWSAVGFRSPAMHHNLEWISHLNILYDLSTFDVDPFEPQSDGVNTIFPIWIGDRDGNGYVEIPYTLAQDSTLFLLMREKNIDIWKRKLDWIAKHGGMVLLNTHPDYMNFDRRKDGLEEYSFDYYLAFLKYVHSEYSNEYWHVLPKEMAMFWIKKIITT